MKDLLLKLTALAVLGMPFIAQADPILTTNGDGQLTGIRGIMIDGVNNDVIFADGTCVELFGGCDDLNDFLFDNATDALAASQALLNVLTGSAYENSPDRIAGCISQFQCFLITAYGIADNGNTLETAMRIRGGLAGLTAFPGPFSRSPFDDLIYAEPGNLDGVWAVWTRSSVAVPEPGTLGLLGAGLLVLGAMRRRKRV